MSNKIKGNDSLYKLSIQANHSQNQRTNSHNFIPRRKRMTPQEEYDLHDKHADAIASKLLAGDNNFGQAASSPEEINAAKYGSKQDDVIAQQYKESQIGGNYFCKGNIEKYIRRFCKEGSPKAGNVKDLLKAQDFLNRMIEMNQDKVKDEVIEK